MRLNSSPLTMPGGRAPGLGHQHHLLLRQPGRDDQPAARQLRQQRDIDAAVDDEFLEPHHAGMHHLEFDPREIAAHPREQLGHQDRAQGRGDAEDDAAAGMGVLGADFVAGALDVAQDAGGAFQQLLAGLGQPDAAIGAGEQRHAELLLEPLHMPGQRRLREVQMRRGAGDAAEFGDADEVIEAAQFHGRRSLNRSDRRSPCRVVMERIKTSVFARCRRRGLGCSSRSVVSVEGAVMEFGWYHEIHRQVPRANAMPTRSSRRFQQAEAADRWGLDGFWLAEIHQQARRSVLSAPMNVAGRDRRRTKRIKVGTAVQVLPLTHPLRLAEETATVDQISRGRLMLGVGRSGNPRGYARLRRAIFGKPRALLRDARHPGEGVDRRTSSRTRASITALTMRARCRGLSRSRTRRSASPAPARTPSRCSAQLGYPLFVSVRSGSLAGLAPDLKTVSRRLQARPGIPASGEVLSAAVDACVAIPIKRRSTRPSRASWPGTRPTPPGSRARPTCAAAPNSKMCARQPTEHAARQGGRRRPRAGDRPAAAVAGRARRSTASWSNSISAR